MVARAHGPVLHCCALSTNFPSILFVFDGRYFRACQVAAVFIAIRNTIPFSWCGLLLIGAATGATAATPTLNGQSGYVNMPSATVEADGTFTAGYSYDSPYGSA